MGTATKTVVRMSGLQVCAMLDISRRDLAKLVASGRLHPRRALPTSWPKFDLSEVQRLAEELADPASA